MEESDNGNDEINRYNDRYEKSVTDLFEEKELKTKWHKEILENPSMQEHFKDFHPCSIDTFITFYLIEKYFAYKYADSYQRRVEQKRSRWIDAAHDHLKVIQHKKLFDLQCLWRAEQITVDGLDVTYDFLIWKDDVMNCPFIEPVNKFDIEMYQDFLLTADVDYRNLDDLWELQNYDDFRENYNGNEDDGLPLPDWYEFHNLRTGNSSLLILPDIRGDKEKFYIKLHRGHLNENNPPSAPYVPDTRPFLLTSDRNLVTFFVNTFEDEETRKKYANYSELNKKNDRNDFGLDELLMHMENEDEYIPIEAHYDYRQALLDAYNTFQLKKLAEHLPLAFEQYLFNRKMGLIVEEEENVFKETREKYIEMILDGRERNGEERSLDF